MVASVLLRWKYMWIALAILTLLFLLACGYAACTTRRNSLRRQDCHDDTRIIDQRRNIPSVSGDIDHCPEVLDN